MGNEIPGKCFPGKFVLDPILEPKVPRMKTTLASCTNERQSIASEKVIIPLSFLKSIAQLPDYTRFVWRKVNTFGMLGLQVQFFCMYVKLVYRYIFFLIIEFVILIWVIFLFIKI